MTAILNLILICSYPFTWFGRFKESIWLHLGITILNGLLPIFYFIEGKWWFGCLFILTTLMWGHITYMKYQSKKRQKLLEEIRTQLNDITEGVDEWQQAMMDLIEAMRRVRGVAVEEEKKTIKPKKDIKKFKL